MNHTKTTTRLLPLLLALALLLWAAPATAEDVPVTTF